jgi:hypothetical protein
VWTNAVNREASEGEPQKNGGRRTRAVAARENAGKSGGTCGKSEGKRGKAGESGGKRRTARTARSRRETGREETGGRQETETGDREERAR